MSYERRGKHRKNYIEVEVGLTEASFSFINGTERLPVKLALRTAFVDIGG